MKKINDFLKSKARDRTKPRCVLLSVQNFLSQRTFLKGFATSRMDAWVPVCIFVNVKLVLSGGDWSPVRSGRWPFSFQRRLLLLLQAPDVIAAWRCTDPDLHHVAKFACGEMMDRSSEARTGAALKGPSSEDQEAAGDWLRRNSSQLQYEADVLPLVRVECELAGTSLRAPRHFHPKGRF